MIDNGRQNLVMGSQSKSGLTTRWSRPGYLERLGDWLSLLPKLWAEGDCPCRQAAQLDTVEHH